MASYALRRAGVRRVARVATQAKERCWLMQQVIRDRSVWIVTVTAILCHRRVLPNERSLHLRVALVTDIVHRFRLQVPLCLAVAIMAVGAGLRDIHLS